MESSSVHFSMRFFPSTYLYVRARGVLRMEGDALVLELQEDRTNLNTTRKTRGAVQTRRISIDDVEVLEVRRRGLLGRKLVLCTRGLAALADVLFANGAECSIPLRAAEVDRARDLAAAVALHQVDSRLRQLGAGDALGG
jgi:hypothetical protein